ncbi:glycoside hydrolase family 65 protein [Mucilaginibacter phyllosphaerae]|uniref:Glycoside hydrolase family 65 protein n=1 Tax=Mucilaginibacter phyllosphaerae TaxID=1812349 RepID=A0A4Y8A831_9SPHI|nr:glycoside hydrolase family 65 protein [Mucilaginibacter phyllosphaerae]MBB3970534.1 maltose phosphorylase [Mucilaginibacter phyllosphaerae]TEW64546.1 glycoside hydrolase family 65 protein [Mucilaginibacter phyllosphaerae]GGH19369.1 maltose phosphorylase [Mucilaginibacter phyllosphaerae]
MKEYFKVDEWKIIEESFDPQYNKVTESVFSLGNGRMGQRANFEEAYSGETLQGNYVAGVYYPDKTRVGWWKNGYPEYFAKVLNAANWIGIDMKLGDEQLDLAECEVLSFRRELNMKEGYLQRNFKAKTKLGKELEVEAIRFCSMADDEAGAIKYTITPLNFEEEISITPFIDGDIVNKDSNYDEKFWDEVGKAVEGDNGYVHLRTKKTGFEVVTAMMFAVVQDGKNIDAQSTPIQKEKYIAAEIKLQAKKGQSITLIKYAVNVSSQNYAAAELVTRSAGVLKTISAKGFDTMLAEQAAAWAEKWKHNDIMIEGDAAAQQGIRFNIFQLNQTYTGEDDRLNIGPKGFTGEKYGGSTYWDTEAYCVPFYLATAEQKVARNLLLYRYKQLGKAIDNAKLLGFKDGAALYPMVTMDGTECHNEWEITFEEIHRNGAIAFAIFNYIRYTGDEAYLTDYGLEVLIAISRFWVQRITWSADKQQYVMLGVTGPNEYENNVNNNWYTSTIAVWCLKYTIEAIGKVKEASQPKYNDLVAKTGFREEQECEKFADIIRNMYFAHDDKLGIFLQQDGYLDKEQILVKDLPASEQPLVKKWSWDRILRSVYIKQADVLQGLYFFEDNYDLDTIRRNYDFYEPRTVHESSLSPCVHAILAARLGDIDRAYQFYLRTSRLDIDDYNSDTDDGCHITSMAGTWMSVVEGFGGMRVKDGKLSFNPLLPHQWQAFSFRVGFRGASLNIKISKEGVLIKNLSDAEIVIKIYGSDIAIKSNSEKLTPVQASTLE